MVHSNNHTWWPSSLSVLLSFWGVKTNASHLFIPLIAPRAALRGIDFQPRSAEGASEWANVKALRIVSLFFPATSRLLQKCQEDGISGIESQCKDLKIPTHAPSLRS